MNKIINEINNEIEKIENILVARDSSGQDITVAKYFLHLWKNKRSLNKIEEVSRELNISKSSISKFIKKYNLKNYQVIKYIYFLNTISFNSYDPKEWKEKTHENVKIAIEKIKNAKKVLLVGTGNSGLVAKSFYTRLILAGINAIYLEGKPDQMTMIERMQKNDLIICISFSLSHQWSKSLLKKNVSKLIFTGQLLKSDQSTIVFSNYKTQTYKYRNIDISTLNFLNIQIENIIKMLKWNK